MINGQRFGRYRLLNRISIGGTFKVFLAFDELAPSRPNCVIKRTLVHLCEYPEVIRVLRDDLRVAATVTHPNLVKVFEVEEIEGQVVVSFENLEGSDLSHLIRSNRMARQTLAPVLATSIVSAACAALHHVHSLGLFHGMPTPSEIRVTRAGGIKVMGLGFWRAESLLRVSGGGMLKGKVQFLSPEEIRGEPLDLRSDVFLLGLILFEALTGVRAFVRESELQTIRSVLEDKVALPSSLVSGIPQALDHIVLKALQRDPRMRFTSADEMRQALDELA
jgi:eukaryotic-like serine/threonine-protein kinase